MKESYTGIIKKDARTKHLIERLNKGDIALVNHADMDRVTAESLVESKIEMVINAAETISGKYPNQGPQILLSNGIYIIDNVGEDVFDKLEEGDVVTVKNALVYRGDTVIGSGHELTEAQVQNKMNQAQETLNQRIDDFTRNTLSYLNEEKEILFSDMWVPPTRVSMNGQHVLVLVRGYDYLEDLQSLRGYIQEVNPVLIGVDGGADALLDEGYEPDIIIGDMDSVSDEALQCGAQIIVHTYEDGRSPGLRRIEKLGLQADRWALPSTSEDLALLLAYHSGADLIVAVGTHFNLVEQLDKGREGMSSTFLVRLKVGNKLMDAKGLSRLYTSAPQIKHLGIIIAAALVAIIAVFFVSPELKDALRLAIMTIRARFGL